MLQERMLPFGQTVLLWRLHRNLSQAELAGRARLPRPNLSAIERGSREVTLKTIRALALALDIAPGQLVDGVPPVVSSGRWSRDALERVSDAVAEKKRLQNPEEEILAQQLGRLVRSQCRAHGFASPRAWRSRRGGHRAWLQVSARIPPKTLRSLLERIHEKSGRLSA